MTAAEKLEIAIRALQNIVDTVAGNSPTIADYAYAFGSCQAHAHSTLLIIEESEE